MHLLDIYALTSASKINKPYILEHFFPLAVEKYITFHPRSKYESKCYDYWQDVLEIIVPILNKNGISVVQIGTKEDKVFQGVYNAAGQTTLNQCANILSKSLLHLSVDSFGTHIASHFNIPIVCLYSNNYANNVRPFWGDKEKQILIEPERKGRPSFSENEFPKSINSIPPEFIAEKVLLLMGFEKENTFNYNTIYVGEEYHLPLIEMAPDSIIDPKQFGTEHIIVRMDYLFNESVLLEQLKRSKCTIYTDRPISDYILLNYRGNIKEIILEIKKDSTNLEFADFLRSNGFSFHLLTREEGEEYNEIKFEYLDYPSIHQKYTFDENKIKSVLEKSEGKKIYYKSSKFTLSNGKIYPSKEAWKNGLNIENQFEVSLVPESKDFWRELPSFRILVDKKD